MNDDQAIKHWKNSVLTIAPALIGMIYLSLTSSDTTLSVLVTVVSIAASVITGWYLSSQEDSTSGSASEDNTRMLKALDVCNTNVMIADASNTIIYLNESVQQMLNEAEPFIKSELPNFNSRSLVGTNMDVFHKNPAHQQGMVASLRSTYKTRIKVGGRVFGLIATPLFNEAGERVGTVVEWEDKTDALAQEEREQEISKENLRIRSALDVCNTNVMMADEDLNILYTSL